MVYLLPELSSWLISHSVTMQEKVFSALRGNRTLEQMLASLLLSSPRVWIEALQGGLSELARSG
jgi:hypothetical protein